MEMTQLWTAPCGCSFLQIHKGDGSEPRHATKEEAEAISPGQPEPVACAKHAHHDDSFKRFDEVCKETKSHHHAKVE